MLHPPGFFVRFRVDLLPALGTGDDDFSLAHRHTAHGAALAGEVLVIPVRPAGLGSGGVAFDLPEPVHELLVLLPPLGQVLGEHSEENENHQHPEQCFTGDGRRPQPQEIKENLGQKDPDVAPQERLIHLIHAVPPVHKPRHGASEFIKHTSAASFHWHPSGYQNCLPSHFNGKVRERQRFGCEVYKKVISFRELPC